MRGHKDGYHRRRRADSGRAQIRKNRFPAKKSGYRSETDRFNHALEPTRMAQRVGSLRRSARHHLRIVSRA
jgi:hypothetical protein